MNNYPYKEFMIGIIILTIILLYFLGKKFYLNIFLPFFIFLLNPFIFLLTVNNKFINIFSKLIMILIHGFLFFGLIINNVMDDNPEKENLKELFGIIIDEKMLIFYSVIIVLSYIITSVYMIGGRRGGGGGGGGRGGGRGGGDGGRGGDRGGASTSIRYRPMRMNVGNGGIAAGAA